MEWWIAILGLVLLAWVLRGWLRGRKGGPEQPFSGAAAPEAARLPASYSANNVGNDASARPWEQPLGAADATLSPAAGEAGAAPPWGAADSNLPAGFDAAAFLEASKAHFIQLQAAWDRADIPALRAMMTDDMLGQIQSQLIEREHQPDAVGPSSEVVMLDAKLLGIDVRPSSGMLYGLAADGTIYTLDAMSGQATKVSTINVAPAMDATVVDFNPVADRLRVVTASGRSRFVCT